MWALGMSKLNHSQSIGFFVYLNFLQYQACMVLEEKLNNEKTNGSEYLKLDIPSEYLAAPGQSEGIGAGGGGGMYGGGETVCSRQPLTSLVAGKFKQNYEGFF